MKNLTDIENKIKNKEKMIIILDYDSVIAPIRPECKPPFLNNIFKRILENFGKQDFIEIKILTDKRVQDFKKDFPIDTKYVDIYGVYGAEIEDSNGIRQNTSSKILKETAKLNKKLKNAISNYSKITLESKKHSLILNYRFADKESINKIKDIIKEEIVKLESESDFIVLDKIDRFEVISSELIKENTVQAIGDLHQSFDVIYIGDDEDAIKRAKQQGLTAIGIRPLREESQKLIDFSITQNQLEEFLINTNNLYL